MAEKVYNALNIAAHDLEYLLIAGSDFEAHLILPEFAAHGGGVVGALVCESGVLLHESSKVSQLRGVLSRALRSGVRSVEFVDLGLAPVDPRADA